MLCVYLKRDYKELGAGEPEISKVSYLSLRHRRADDVVLGSKSRKSLCFSSSLQAGKKPSVPVQREWGRENPPLPGRQWAFLFYSGLPQIKWGPPTLGRVLCFIQSMNRNLISSQHIPTETPRVIFDQTSGYYVAQSIVRTKLTITLGARSAHIHCISHCFWPFSAHGTRKTFYIKYIINSCWSFQLQRFYLTFFNPTSVSYFIYMENPSFQWHS